MDNSFELNFASDSDVEQELDTIVDALKDDIEADESKITLLSGMRLKQLQFTYAALLYITKGTNSTVTYKLYEPFKTMGSVSVEGEVLAFNKPEWFAKVAEFASNTEVYPLAKNKVRMTFTFHGLTAPIE